MSVKFEIEVSTLNEGTDSPYWLILDPRQMMSACVESVASMITGPFFSREEAETHLKNRSHAFGKKAVVYCHSGYWAKQYKALWRTHKETTQPKSEPS